MGLNRHSSSHSHTEYVYVDKYPDGNPNPERFEVLNTIVMGDYLLAEVKYPDATNFEGKKVMLYKGIKTLVGIKKLDPHFSSGKAISPIMRFVPTTKGWMMGVAVMKMLVDEDL